MNFKYFNVEVKREEIKTIEDAKAAWMEIYVNPTNIAKAHGLDYDKVRKYVLGVSEMHNSPEIKKAMLSDLGLTEEIKIK